jgi:hypothetical protein
MGLTFEAQRHHSSNPIPSLSNTTETTPIFHNRDTFKTSQGLRFPAAAVSASRE